MENKKYLIVACFLTVILFLISVSSAQSANSSNYSVNKFASGVIGSLAEGNTLKARFLTTAFQPSTNNAGSNSFTTNLGFFGNSTYTITVSIQSYSISPQSAIIGSTINLSISALNEESVWAKITSPDSQEQIINLINNDIIVYSPPSVTGTYEVIFYANSSSGAVASVIDYFELTESPNGGGESSSGGSGGGSGSSGGNSGRESSEESNSEDNENNSCSYIWDCTPWSLCSEGKQKRECKNTGNCEGNENRPIEEIKCTESLFDISLELKDITLKDKNLIFNIELEEIIGSGKIDVHIKYSIIKENEEIFSQIETKAIEKTLSFSKTIDEIKLPDGKYILRVDILYGNLQRAFAEQSFLVKNGRIALIRFNFNNLFSILGIILMVVFASIFLAGRFNQKIKESKLPKYSIIAFSITFLAMAIISIPYRLEFTGRIIDIATNSNILYALIVLSMLILVIFIIRIKLKKKGKADANQLKALINKEIYSSEGEKVGKIKEVYIDNKPLINGLLISLDKKISGAKNKKIIIPYNAVKSVGEIMIIDDAVLKQLSLNQNSINHSFS